LSAVGLDFSKVQIHQRHNTRALQVNLREVIMATKTTKSEIEIRVSQVYKLLLIGTSRRDILRYASEKWQSSDRSTDAYIASARKLMSKELSDDRQMALGEEIELRRHIIQKALVDKKYQIALTAADSRAKLRGLFMPLEMAINVVTAHGYEVSDPTEITDKSADTLADILTT